MVYNSSSNSSSDSSSDSSLDSSLDFKVKTPEQVYPEILSPEQFEYLGNDEEASRYRGIYRLYNKIVNVCKYPSKQRKKLFIEYTQLLAKRIFHVHRKYHGPIPNALKLMLDTKRHGNKTFIDFVVDEAININKVLDLNLRRFQKWDYDGIIANQKHILVRKMENMRKSELEEVSIVYEIHNDFCAINELLFNKRFVKNKGLGFAIHSVAESILDRTL